MDESIRALQAEGELHGQNLADSRGVAGSLRASVRAAHDRGGAR